MTLSFSMLIVVFVWLAGVTLALTSQSKRPYCVFKWHRHVNITGNLRRDSVYATLYDSMYQPMERQSLILENAQTLMGRYDHNIIADPIKMIEINCIDDKLDNNFSLALLICHNKQWHLHSFFNSTNVAKSGKTILIAPVPSLFTVYMVITSEAHDMLELIVVIHDEEFELIKGVGLGAYGSTDKRRKGMFHEEPKGTIKYDSGSTFGQADRYSYAMIVIVQWLFGIHKIVTRRFQYLDTLRESPYWHTIEDDFLPAIAFTVNVSYINVTEKSKLVVRIRDQPRSQCNVTMRSGSGTVHCELVAVESDDFDIIEVLPIDGAFHLANVTLDVQDAPVEDFYTFLCDFRVGERKGEIWTIERQYISY